MNKWREDSLAQDIHRIANAFERIASAIDKPDDEEKIEVIRCKDCIYWKNRMRIFCGETDADFFCGHAMRKRV